MGKKLLVADDSVTIQKVIKLALSSEGYEIMAVSDGREAIRAIKEEKPDVVLIDVVLSGADAYTVKKAINDEPALRKTGFILLISAFEKIDESQINTLKFDGRLVKPFDPTILRKVVSDVLKKAETATDDFALSPSEIPPLTEFKDVLPELSTASPTVDNLVEKSGTISVDLTSHEISHEISEEEEEEKKEEEARASIENDIKDLTESTIKLSGLDNFQWSLDDQKKMKSRPSSAERGSDATREIRRPLAQTGESPLKSVLAESASYIDDGGSNFPIDDQGSQGFVSAFQAPYQPPTLETPESSNFDFSVPEITIPNIGRSGRDAEKQTEPTPVIPSKTEAAQTSGLSRSEIEAIVRRDLNAALEKVIRDTVPQIAEKIIRTEIEKLLSE